MSNREVAFDDLNPGDRIRIVLSKKADEVGVFKQIYKTPGGYYMSYTDFKGKVATAKTGDIVCIYRED